MGLEIYTGVSATPGTSETSDPLNKIAITAESLRRKLSFHGALITTSYDNITPRAFSQGSDLELPFDTVVFDTDGFWDQGSPTQLTIPEGFSSAEIWAIGRFPSSGWKLRIMQVGVTLPLNSADVAATGTNEHQHVTAKSQKLSVGVGYSFKANLFVPGSSTISFDTLQVYGYNGTIVTRQAQSQLFQLMVRAYI